MRQSETLILAGVAVLGTAGLVYALTRPKSTPSPSPSPGPSPTPSANVQQLITQAQALLAQAATNPNSVSDTQIDQLADQLAAAGQSTLAAQLRSAAAAVRLAKNGQNPPPPTPARAALLLQAQALLGQAASSPLTTDPSELDRVGTELEAVGETDMAIRLHNTATLLRALRGIPGPTPAVGGVVTQPPRPTLALIGAYLANPATNPSDVDRLANALAARGFASHVARLRARSAELRAARRSGGHAFR